MIQGRRWLIAVDVLESEDPDEDVSIDHNGDFWDEEDERDLVGAGVTEQVEDMQKAVKYSYISSYMLKPSHLLTQGFENNRMAQEMLFKHMFNFGARAEWRQGRRGLSSYLGVEITKDQCRLLNPTTLYCIAGYILEDAVDYRALNSLPKIRLDFIDGSTSSHCSILNSTKIPEKISQAHKLASSH